jgi:hypothetical protein
VVVVVVVVINVVVVDVTVVVVVVGFCRQLHPVSQEKPAPQPICATGSHCSPGSITPLGLQPIVSVVVVELVVVVVVVVGELVVVVSVVVVVLDRMVVVVTMVVVVVAVVVVVSVDVVNVVVLEVCVVVEPLKVVVEEPVSAATIAAPLLRNKTPRNAIIATADKNRVTSPCVSVNSDFFPNMHFSATRGI